MTFRSFVVAVVALLLSSAPALAQTGVPTSWTARYYVQGAPVAVHTFIVTTAQALCNQPRTPTPTPPPPPSVNPDTLVWDDPVNAGRDCLFADAARLTGLADGNYAVTLAAVNADGASAEHSFVPFVRRRPNPPGVPTGLRITRQGP